ncbi:uncharacterized protein EI97DRAFT_437259 [Westerdykella ornata]|uniref:Uncharacterized protein n=1 Tax=Westerdykella ornata TaxID=318751 RepID=A0A6A6J7E5_WESOR|nr:uncharacterized protein EI97DRAFT_437259 [Westerdykella ornata]KAF2272073.1 hypothetical protein EI97DRAFT_437259 [Westerdykella ornata]
MPLSKSSYTFSSSKMVDHATYDDPPPTYSDPATDPAMGMPVLQTSQQMNDYGTILPLGDDPHSNIHDRSGEEEWSGFKIVLFVIWVGLAIILYSTIIKTFWEAYWRGQGGLYGPS